MKRYTFRLASVLRVRRIQENQAKAAALLANKQVALARTTVAARQDHLARYTAQRAEEMALLGSAADYKAYKTLQNLAAEGIAFSEDRLDEAIELAEQKRTEWAAEKQRVQTMERLDERRREEYRIDLQREDAKELDDIVVGRHGRKS